jgi:hypothetical protein
MKYILKYDKQIIGFAAGIVLPLLVGLIIYFFSADGVSVIKYIEHLNRSNIITHSISLCVFPNILIFLIFSRLNMLKATRGVLAVTIIWALLVFAIKLLTFAHDSYRLSF